MTIAAQKAALRRQAAAARAVAHGRTDPAEAIARLLAWIAGRPGTPCIAAYAAMRTEIDPLPALDVLHARGHPICLPVVTGPERPLEFRAWRPGAPLRAGAFGTLAPQDGPPVTPGLLIVPLLAFDDRLYRLGYGGGYYDRTLAALGPIVPAIGLAYEAQRVPLVPAEPTDVPLDAVATEAALHLA